MCVPQNRRAIVTSPPISDPPIVALVLECFGWVAGPRLLSTSCNAFLRNCIMLCLTCLLSLTPLRARSPPLELDRHGGRSSSPNFKFVRPSARNFVMSLIVIMIDSIHLCYYEDNNTSSSPPQEELFCQQIYIYYINMYIIIIVIYNYN